MYGDGSLFESMINDFEAIENNPKKNIDESEKKFEINWANHETYFGDVGGEHWEGTLQSAIDRLEKGENGDWIEVLDTETAETVATLVRGALGVRDIKDTDLKDGEIPLDYYDSGVDVSDVGEGSTTDEGAKVEEAEEDGKKFGVVLTGGSLGEPEHQPEWFDTKEEADDYKKRRNKLLSPGEKKYYRLKYKSVKSKKVKESSDLWDKIVDKLDGTHSKWESVLDLMAQVWNGGFDQWIDNGYAEREGKLAIDMLRKLGTDAGNQMADMTEEAMNSDYASEMENLIRRSQQGEPFDEEEAEELQAPLELLSNRFWDELDDQLVKDLAVKLQIGEAKGTRMYGDKTKFESMINDFEAIEKDSKKNIDVEEGLSREEVDFETKVRIRKQFYDLIKKKMSSSDALAKVSKDYNVSWDVVSRLVGLPEAKEEANDAGISEKAKTYSHQHDVLFIQPGSFSDGFDLLVTREDSNQATIIFKFVSADAADAAGAKIADAIGGTYVGAKDPRDEKRSKKEEEEDVEEAKEDKFRVSYVDENGKKGFKVVSAKNAEAAQEKILKSHPKWEIKGTFEVNDVTRHPGY